MISRRAGLVLLFLVLALSGCGSSDDDRDEPIASAKVSRDSLPDGLYHDFLDGKYDGSGHPLASQVWQAESECQAKTGKKEAEGRGFRPGKNAAGVACAATSNSIGVGRFTLNARVLSYATCESGCDPSLPVLTLEVLDEAGNLLEKRDVAWQDFESALEYENASIGFTKSSNGPVTIRVTWPGKVGARLDYVELFRSTKNLSITPPSSILLPNASFVVEALDAPTDAKLTARCDDLDLAATLDALLESGSASKEDTDFRSIYTIPADALLSACPRPTRVRFSVVTPGSVHATARVTIYDEQPACGFTTGTTRVLLTGFEPFPADSSADNSSNEAIFAFDPAAVPGISLMRLTLPVEYDTAAGIVGDVTARCNPDIIVGFGQGRSEVDLETTAYNLQDSSDFAGGFPDNRGHIGEGEPNLAGGPAEHHSGLPTDSIRAKLDAAGIANNLSDDPGRFVCNNVFYRIMTESAGTGRVSGFVHLPRIPSVDAADRQMLATVVTAVVTSSLK